MLKEAIQKHAFNCGLSNRLQKKYSIVIEILDECSSGLSAAKHSQLIDIMKLKICNPDNLEVQKNILDGFNLRKNSGVTIALTLVVLMCYIKNK